MSRRANTPLFKRTPSTLTKPSTKGLRGSSPMLNTTSVAAQDFVDYELLCDFAYADYLQALMEEQRVSKVVGAHKRDMKDQLSIQKDYLFGMKTKLKQAQEELNTMKISNQMSEFLNCVQNNFDALFRLRDNHQVEGILNQLVQVLESKSKEVNVKNVKEIKDQEDFDELFSRLKQLNELCVRMELSKRNDDLANQLATVIRRFGEVFKGATREQSVMANGQDLVTRNLLKSISDTYARKEKYPVQIK
ncbi:hypothetical protein TcasGA2_TC008272 [Tribolium castaneum]|uniref:Uncharacterized protein n=1 Tax=Tribolium castaneum TaxID=7070 RepID=D2A0U8_TRICA|nr:hypothetical protein TcasGA2_TC008272 [Tribolium castaneum]